MPFARSTSLTPASPASLVFSLVFSLQVTDSLATAEAENPDTLNGKIVMLRSRSDNFKKAPYLSSCPNEGSAYSWIDVPLPDYGWRVVYDREAELKSGETTMYLERWCNHKKRPRAEYLESNMRTGAGYSWGVSMREQYGWKVHFGEDAENGGTGEVLSLSAEKEYISDKPHCHFTHMRKVALYGNIPHEEGRYLKVRGNGEGAGWGPNTKAGEAFDWDIVVLKDPNSNVKPNDQCENVNDKSVKQGEECIADRQCAGVGRKHGMCRLCGKCQFSLRDVNPCDGDNNGAALVKIGGDMDTAKPQKAKKVA